MPVTGSSSHLLSYQTNRGITIKLLYVVGLLWHAFPFLYSLFATDLPANLEPALSPGRSEIILSLPKQLNTSCLLSTWLGAQGRRSSIVITSQPRNCVCLGFFVPIQWTNSVRAAVQPWENMFSPLLRQESRGGKHAEIRFKVTKAIVITTWMCGTRWSTLR